MVIIMAAKRAVANIQAGIGKSAIAAEAFDAYPLADELVGEDSLPDGSPDEFGPLEGDEAGALAEVGVWAGVKPGEGVYGVPGMRVAEGVDAGVTGDPGVGVIDVAGLGYGCKEAVTVGVVVTPASELLARIWLHELPIVYIAPSLLECEQSPAKKQVTSDQTVSASETKPSRTDSTPSAMTVMASAGSVKSSPTTLTTSSPSSTR